MLGILLWIAAALMALEVLMLIAKVGKPREPIGGSQAVGGVIEWGFIIVVVVLAALQVS